MDICGGLILNGTVTVLYIYIHIVESDIKGKITGFFFLWDIPLNQQLDLIGKERVHNFHRKRSQSSALSLNVESTQDKKSTRGGYNINNVMGILLVYYWYIIGILVEDQIN